MNNDGLQIFEVPPANPYFKNRKIGTFMMQSFICQADLMLAMLREMTMWIS
jgi:hypothetical protein